MKLKRTLILILTAILVIAVGLQLTGCGDDKKDTEPTQATIAATVAATEQPTQATAATQAQISQSTQADDDDEDNDDDDYPDEATAIANVRSLAGSGAEIISTEKGYSPDGIPAWIIVVAPVTNGNVPDTVTYYSGKEFCYAAEDEESEDETEADEDSGDYIDEPTAIANVRAQVGSGAEIISSEKGYTPDGIPAWIIVVAPVTTSDGDETITYYSGEQFCYPDTSGQ